MSELEKIRAISFLSILTITLVVLFALQSRSVAPVSPSEALQICATSKGALCPDPTLGRAHSAARETPVKRGAMTDTRPQPTPAVLIASGDEPVAVLGEMTVVAARLPTDRMADLAALREVALRLARGPESGATHASEL